MREITMYCSGCDRNVKAVLTDEPREEGQAAVFDTEVICLEIGEHCSGSCPVGAVSAEELAQREEHMRQRLECDGRFATYALRVESDGLLIGEAVVHGAGLRHDRPLYVLREYDVAPGVHRLRVSFTRREKTDDDAAAFAPAASAEADTGLFAGRAQREAVEHARRARRDSRAPGTRHDARDRAAPGADRHVRPGAPDAPAAA